jgi:hypothetical protein
MKKPWPYRIALSFDQMLHVLLFNGDEDETISSRAGKAARKGRLWARCFCWLLNIVDKGHCEKAIEHDEGERVK